MRKVLLLEPNYKNKYPPIGLMKLATYFRLRGDDVVFYFSNNGCQASSLKFVLDDNSSTTYTYTTTTIPQKGKAYTLPEITNANWTKQ